MPPQATEAGRYRDQPPVDWRGAGSVQGSPYPPRPDAAAWQPAAGYPPAPPPGEAPPGYPGYHSAHVGYGRDGASAEADAGIAAAGSATGAAPAVTAASVPALTDAQAPAGTSGGR